MTTYQIRPNNLSINFQELTEGPSGPSGTGTISDDNQVGVCKYKCNWSDVKQLTMELLGYSQAIDDDIIMYLPHKFPHHSFDALFADSVDFAPFEMKATPNSDDSRFVDYTSAILTVTYKPNVTEAGSIEDPTEDLIISENLNPSSEFITLPTNGLYWDSLHTEALSSEEAPSQIIRMMEWELTIYKLSEIHPAILTLAGAVNLGAVTSRTLGLTFAADTLLFGNPTIGREFTTSGVGFWTITFRFIWKENGWNVFPKPSAGGDANGQLQWSAIYDSNGNRLYPYKRSNYNTILSGIVA